MELRSAIRSRHMVRDLRAEPLERDVLDDLLDLARRAPSAGNTAAVSFIVLEGDEVSRYWDVTLPEDRRGSFAYPGLLQAPVIVIVTTEPGAYVRRYQEDDKSASGLGGGAEHWRVPYWWVDAGAVIENMLLLAVEAGLGALLFGPFEHEQELCEALGVPEGVRLVGAVALGWPAAAERRGASAGRRRPRLEEIVHRGCW